MVLQSLYSVFGSDFVFGNFEIADEVIEDLGCMGLSDN